MRVCAYVGINALQTWPWLTYHYPPAPWFTPKISNTGPKGDTESRSVRKTSFVIAQGLLRFCWAQLGYEEMIVYIAHLVCIGKLAALPPNSSLVVSQGTTQPQLQDKGLQRVRSAKYCIPLGWINLTTGALHRPCRNRQRNEWVLPDIKWQQCDFFFYLFRFSSGSWWVTIRNIQGGEQPFWESSAGRRDIKMTELFLTQSGGVVMPNSTRRQSSAQSDPRVLVFSTKRTGDCG